MMRRRDFLKKTSSLFFLSSSSYFSKALGNSQSLSNSVRIAVIGTGGMGTRHLEALAVNPQCVILAVCDVAKSRYYEAIKIVENLSNKTPDGYQDFRRVLERSDIDAVFVATPDHWHPLITIMACKAGKDVYVEKPVCTTIQEGRAMVDTARRYGRVVQVGTQQRSMPVFQKAMHLIHSGVIGTITSARAWVGVNEWKAGEKIEPIPKGLDWDLWLGPAPYVPFSKERFVGFMGFFDYARGGQLTNWGIHLMDVVHWGIQQDSPLTVYASGGSYRQGAGADNYETIEAVFEYPGCLVTWEQRHSSTHGNKAYGIAFYGTEGALFIDRNSFIIKPDSKGIPEFIGEPEKSWANPQHHNNFFECIRTRNIPVADIEQGFRSTSAVLLAGISLRCKRKLVWDKNTERFVNDSDANKYLIRAYRPPWHL
ncbi:MAG: Gfo/Idh/MocA family oxidoreductase [Candidatus Hydrogenedentes bacterium]|nr:Gfo/Idh/MocA family oxidoreductase [Candidatus Hydrogenedentota bacterium]